jgi:hypothetical protein
VMHKPSNFSLDPPNQVEIPSFFRSETPSYKI